MRQIYRRKSIPKCDFNFIEITLRHGSSPVNLLHIFKAPFSKNTSGGMLLNFAKSGLHCSCSPVNSQNISEEISHLIHPGVCFCHCFNHKFNEIVISDNQNNKIYFSLEKKQLLLQTINIFIPHNNWFNGYIWLRDNTLTQILKLVQIPVNRSNRGLSSSINHKIWENLTA